MSNSMTRRSFFGLSVALVGVAVGAQADSLAAQSEPHHSHAASLMAECANRLLAALDTNQRGNAVFPFDADERKNWHFIPNNSRVAVDELKERKGLPLRDMSPYQRHLASALLAAGLSQTGFVKAGPPKKRRRVLRSSTKPVGIFTSPGRAESLVQTRDITAFKRPHS